MAMDVLTNIFWNDGLEYANHGMNNSKLTGLRKFKSFYGINPEICAILWNKLEDRPVGSEPKHLLWCMLFLKNYNIEHVNCAITKVDEKTFRLWVWRFVELLADLDVVYSSYSTLDMLCLQLLILGEMGKPEEEFRR